MNEAKEIQAVRLKVDAAEKRLKSGRFVLLPDKPDCKYVYIRKEGSKCQLKVFYKCANHEGEPFLMKEFE